MSDHIPLEIQTEIIKKLPIKSVVRCRSVSKLWKSVIDSSKFIHSYKNTQQHLLVKYKLDFNEARYAFNEAKYVSILYDDTFPNQKSPLTVPQPVSQLGYISSVSSVNGLLCIFGLRRDVLFAYGGNLEKVVVLWNPSIRKYVSVTISNSLQSPNGLTFIGFGVSPDTSDPTLVRINTIGHSTVNWEVEVFMLSTHVWKSVSNIAPALITCNLMSHSAFVNGFIYWFAYNINVDVGTRSNLVISFDLKSHEFGKVCLPDSLVHTNGLTVSKVYESLGLFKYYNYGDKFCDVWIIKESVTKSFTKMFSIKAPDSWVPDSWVRYNILKLKNNGEVIIESIDDTNSSVLEVYDPSS